MQNPSNNQSPKKSSPWAPLVKWLLIALFLGVLTAIAIPVFLPQGNWPLGKKRRQDEAKDNLSALFTLQVAYWGGEGCVYAGRKGKGEGDGQGCFAELGWAPKGPTRYTYWCGDDFIAPTMEGAKTQKCVDATGAPLLYSSTSGGFTICAAGNIDRDDTIDTWSMNDWKILTNERNDVRY